MPLVNALKVTQPIGDFYITVLPAHTIVARVRNRPRTSQYAESEDVQRIFSKKRVTDIANYTENPDATFPTPIILAVSSERVTEVPENEMILDGEQAANTRSRFRIPDDADMIGDVLDGQHRVLGLLKSRFRSEGDFDLVVVLMFDLDSDDKAYVFSIINSKQTPVSASLIYDLFDLSPHRSPQKTCHFVAQAMNKQEGGPFFNRLKMLGRKEEHHTNRVMLSQGTFAARLQELITRDAAADELLEKNKEKIPEQAELPLRRYYARAEDATILKIVQNYFEAARSTFPNEWEDDSGEFVIRKTVGYTALMKVLRRTLPDGFERRDLSLDFFKEKFAVYRENLGNRPLTSEHFPSSGDGANLLYRTLMGEAQAAAQA